MFWVAAIGLAVSAAAGAYSANSAKNTARAQGRIGELNAVTEKHNAWVRRYYAKMEVLANQNILLSQAATFRGNARTLRIQRKRTEQANVENTRRLREDASRLHARQEASLAASGVRVDAGSSLAIYSDTAQRVQRYVADMTYNAERERRNLINAQRDQLQRARMAQIQANVAGMQADALDAGFDMENRRINLQLQSNQIAVRGAVAAANAQMVASVGNALVGGYQAWNVAGGTRTPVATIG